MAAFFGPRLDPGEARAGMRLFAEYVIVRTY
jgi:hypothetical protein